MCYFDQVLQLHADIVSAEVKENCMVWTIIHEVDQSWQQLRTSFDSRFSKAYYFASSPQLTTSYTNLSRLALSLVVLTMATTAIAHNLESPKHLAYTEESDRLRANHSSRCQRLAVQIS